MNPLAWYFMEICGKTEIILSDGIREWKSFRVESSTGLLNKRPDSLDIRGPIWAGAVRGYALSQAQAAAAGAAGLIGLVQDLLFLFPGECREVHLAKVSVRVITGP